MKRALILVVLLLQISSWSWAQSTQDKRRVEEEKRKDLSSSEAYLIEAKEVRPEDLDLEQNAYFSKLLTKEVADVSDAYRVLVILMGLDDRFSDLDSQIHFLDQEGIIPEKLSREADNAMPLRKGVAAFIFTKAMGIKGGIVLRLFGVNQRYAFKELVHRGIMEPGYVSDVMSGRELVLTLIQAADHMADRQRK
ncbi:MAG: hypothetical protein JW847_01830 [Candidatus Omnitrophica bacterium]|nr:hypothetical protein [Candidatus Omnitrophota bacterium]